MSIPQSRPHQHRLWRRLRESDGDPEPIYERFIARLGAAEDDARLDADADDGTKLRAIAAEAVDWVARELDACIREGETCIAIDGGWALVVIFLHRVDYYLGYALAAASWCSESTPIRTAAIIDGMEAKLHRSTPYDIDQSVDWLPHVRSVVDFLRRARDELAAAREADAATRQTPAPPAMPPREATPFPETEAPAEVVSIEVPPTGDPEPLPMLAIEAPAAVESVRPSPRGAVDDVAVKVSRGRMEPGARAVAAAYQLSREAKPVSLRAACDLAKVDRANLRKNYPEAVATIEALSSPDRAPRRGVRDRRTGDVDAWDSDDDD